MLNSRLMASAQRGTAHIASTLDDIALSEALSGLPANFVGQWLRRHPGAA